MVWVLSVGLVQVSLGLVGPERQGEYVNDLLGSYSMLYGKQDVGKITLGRNKHILTYLNTYIKTYKYIDRYIHMKMQH